MTFPLKDCSCRRCESERDALRAPWLRAQSTLKYVCPDCGQERCPRAYSHERECTSQGKTASCSCATCVPQGNGFDTPMRMILCATCGNKRCPHATDHRNACTGSNEAGQPGSAY